MSNKPAFSSPYRRNITDERVLGLSTMNEQNKRANWNIRVAGNKARIGVWTGIDGDADNGRQTADVDLLTGFALVELLRKVIRTEGTGFADSIRTLRLGKDGWKGGKLPGPSIIVGKDHEGVVFIALLVNKNRPCIKFKMIDDGWFNLVHKGGESFSAAESSQIVATAYANALELFLGTVGTQEHVDTSKNKGNGGGNNRQGNGNGYQNNQYNNNQSNQQSASHDNVADVDDMDW